MTTINGNFKKLNKNYLFAEVGLRTVKFIKENPDKDVIKLGLGDVTRPLCDAVVTAMKDACEEMSKAETFRGYGPYGGYGFLKDTIVDYYGRHGTTVVADEVFISSGAKEDVGSITDLFDNRNSILVPDPVYPVYVDSNDMLGRQIYYIDANEENGFLPVPDENTVGDIIYLCSPNNPTGAVYSKEQLKVWVDFALEKGSTIIFDAAYECFISDKNLPRSIFEIEGARKCAIEICSFSKVAGFTGVRCGYTIIPKELEIEGMNVNELWLKRQTIKFNGVSYIIQRAAQAVFAVSSQEQIQANINYYKNNAKVIGAALTEKGIKYYGGENSPYIWMKCEEGTKSWEYFDYLLNEIAVVGTPGSGFGKNGEGWFRLTAFGDKDKTMEAVERFKKL